jgi:hypothetical protein
MEIKDISTFSSAVGTRPFLVSCIATKRREEKEIHTTEI